VIHEDQPDMVLAARRNAPLVIGLGNGENFLGSDVAAFVEHTKRAISVGQDEIVILRADSVEILGFDGSTVTSDEFTVDWDASAASKGGWPSFMAKEIADQPQAVADTLMGRVDSEGRVSIPEMHGLSAEDIKDIDRIIIVACGTASYAGDIAKYGIEKWSRIPVQVELSHEFRYRNPIVTKNTLIVAISQSGETMDTLMATRYARDLGAKVLAICNTQGATLARESRRAGGCRGVYHGICGSDYRRLSVGSLPSGSSPSDSDQRITKDGSRTTKAASTGERCYC
jgi:glucosamine--fructose-6-phosphate aminotransferase (isomerizing)